MKRMILAATLAVAALGLTARPADAGVPFNCLGCRKCAPCWHKCGAEFLVRQYNAFTPVCMGSLYCDGMAPMTFGTCCPPPAYGNGHGHMPQFGPTGYGGPAGCNSCDPNGMIGQYPPGAGMYPGAPMIAAPGIPPAGFPAIAGGQPMMMPQPGMYPYPQMLAGPGVPMMPGAAPAPGFAMPAPMPGPNMPMAAMPVMPRQ